jgi:hypothetical protein
MTVAEVIHALSRFDRDREVVVKGSVFHSGIADIEVKDVTEQGTCVVITTEELCLTTKA